MHVVFPTFTFSCVAWPVPNRQPGKTISHCRSRKKIAEKGLLLNMQKVLLNQRPSANADPERKHSVRFVATKSSLNYCSTRPVSNATFGKFVLRSRGWSMIFVGSRRPLQL